MTQCNYKMDSTRSVLDINVIIIGEDNVMTMSLTHHMADNVNALKRRNTMLRSKLSCIIVCWEICLARKTVERLKNEIRNSVYKCITCKFKLYYNLGVNIQQLHISIIIYGIYSNVIYFPHNNSCTTQSGRNYHLKLLVQYIII